jgi:dihydropteroate synthase
MKSNLNISPTISPTAARWQLRTRSLEFGPCPLVMGILNVTPDSFSDGGRYFTFQAAIDQAKRMEDEGANILDLGGESTRPYSQDVGEDEELNRIVPVLEQLIGKVAIPISIDTKKSKVAEAAIGLGAEIINDVSGLEADPEMVHLAVKTKAGICAMHMQGTPQTMQDSPSYVNVVEEILSYLQQRDQWLQQQGVAANQICLDPGIGFGKTHQHNLDLLQNAGVFHRTGRPILVGHSRKGFIAKVLGNKDLDRCFGTVGVSLALALQKIQILRVHDVAANVQALKLFMATTSESTLRD